MTFAELLTEVYTHTRRSDLVSLTKTAIRAATLKAHQIDYFSKDIYETSLDFGSLDTRHSLDYVSLIANFRAFKYLRRVEDAADDSTTNFFAILTPEELLDAYGDFRTDVAYVAGRNLEIRSAADFRYAILGCYVHPVATETGYSSWVAALYPDAIIIEAARQVFKTIGQDEKAAMYNKMAAEQYRMLKTDNLSDVGY